MALLAPLIWEVRPVHGSANNGGAFDPVSGTPGTDYSQQDAAQYDWVSGGSTTPHFTNNLSLTNANPSVMTSATYNFAATDVGNVINLTAGTHVTTGRYQIISVAGNAATLDRQAITDEPHADATGYLGGAVGSLDTIYNVIVAGNTIYLAATGHDDAPGARTLTSGTLTSPIYIIGYTNSASGAGTRTNLTSQSWADSHSANGFLSCTGYPTISCAGNLLTLGAYTWLACVAITGTRTGSQFVTGTANRQWRVKFTNSGNNANAEACNCGYYNRAIDCEYNTTGAASSSASYASAYSLYHACRITSTGGHGISCPAVVVASKCLFYNIAAGKAGANIGAANYNSYFIGCTFDRCANAIAYPNSATTDFLVAVINCQATNGTVFFNNQRTATANFSLVSFNNRLRDNGTGDYVGLITNPISNAAGIQDVLTDSDDATEYVNAGTLDFNPTYYSLAKGAGVPPNVDIGCWQRAQISKTKIGGIG